jgi:hypothetical protein
VSLRDVLEEARARRAWVRVERAIESGWIDGHVLDVGPVWFVMDVLGSGIRWEGFEAYRLADVVEVTVPHPRRRFYEAALRSRGDKRPARRGLTAWTLPQLVRWGGARYPVVTLRREQVDPGACWIGVPLAVDDRELVLREITPDATWEAEPTAYDLAEITQLGFGGTYEDALARVAGPPPGWDPGRAWLR